MQDFHKDSTSKQPFKKKYLIFARNLHLHNIFTDHVLLFIFDEDVNELVVLSINSIQNGSGSFLSRKCG